MTRPTPDEIEEIRETVERCDDMSIAHVEAEFRHHDRSFGGDGQTWSSGIGGSNEFWSSLRSQDGYYRGVVMIHLRKVERLAIPIPRGRVSQLGWVVGWGPA